MGPPAGRGRGGVTPGRARFTRSVTATVAVRPVNRDPAAAPVRTAPLTGTQAVPAESHSRDAGGPPPSSGPGRWRACQRPARPARPGPADQPERPRCWRAAGDSELPAASTRPGCLRAVSTPLQPRRRLDRRSQPCCPRPGRHGPAAQVSDSDDVCKNCEILLQYAQYYHAGVSRISPYFTVFLVFHNIVHSFVQRQFADADRHSL